MQINQILIAPVLTEKATNLAQKNVYTFFVHPRASKDQIVRAVRTLYGVTVDRVRILVRKGKFRRVGKKLTPHQSSSRKIVYVSVSKGSIDLFPKP